MWQAGITPLGVCSASECSQCCTKKRQKVLETGLWAPLCLVNPPGSSLRGEYSWFTSHRRAGATPPRTQSVRDTAEVRGLHM